MVDKNSSYNNLITPIEIAQHIIYNINYYNSYLGFVSQLNINSILYFAQEFSLVHWGKALFDEDFETGRLSPVLPSVESWWASTIIGEDGYVLPIAKPENIHYDNPVLENKLSQKEYSLIDSLAKTYVKSSSQSLIDYFHQKDTAWCQTVFNSIDNNTTALTIDSFLDNINVPENWERFIISKDLIKSYGAFRYWKIHEEEKLQKELKVIQDKISNINNASFNDYLSFLNLTR